VADITDTDADAAKDIERGRMNQYNAQDEYKEEEEGSEKQASRDTNLRAAKGVILREELETAMAMREASYDANVEPYRGMMVTDYLQSIVGVGPSAFAIAAFTGAVAGTTDADTDAVKDIDRGRTTNLRVAKGEVLREEEETALEDIYNNVKNDTANVKDEGVVNVNCSTNLGHISCCYISHQPSYLTISGRPRSSIPPVSKGWSF
jgi:hypothetical protein